MMRKSRRMPALFKPSVQEEWKDCDQCFGYGEDVCSDCEGEGCVACDRRGYSVCRICHGLGEVHADDFTWIAVQS
jgi:hypothetical protein